MSRLGARCERQASDRLHEETHGRSFRDATMSASASPAGLVIRPWTVWPNDVLVSARRLYEAAGFVLIEEEHHRSFGKDLVGQTFKLKL